MGMNVCDFEDTNTSVLPRYGHNVSGTRIVQNPDTSPQLKMQISSEYMHI